MDSEKERGDEGEAAYLSTFEAADRRRKKLLIAAAVVFLIVVVVGFFKTIGSLGEMGEEVKGAFEDGTTTTEGAPNVAAPAAEPATVNSPDGGAPAPDTGTTAPAPDAGTTAPAPDAEPAESNPAP